MKDGQHQYQCKNLPAPEQIESKGVRAARRQCVPEQEFIGFCSAGSPLTHTLLFSFICSSGSFSQHSHCLLDRGY